MVDINLHGITMEFDVIEKKMDAELKAKVLAAQPALSEQQLLDAYMAAHKEKFNEEFLQL